MKSREDSGRYDTGEESYIDKSTHGRKVFNAVKENIPDVVKDKESQYKPREMSCKAKDLPKI